MNVLFEDVIQSINFDQHEILKDIIKLHSPDGFELDPTFNKGGFYKAGIPVPKYCYDIKPRDSRAEQADCRDLPLRPESVKSIIFDPPFLACGGVKGKMHRHYSSFDSIQDLSEMYTASLLELSRVLENQGILVFKCQDFVHGRQQFFLHVHVYNMAIEAGFCPIDLFVKLNKTMMISHNFTTQHFARKMHSYFWVFRKPGRRKR